MAAGGQHLLDRALADQLVVVIAFGHHHRHAAAHEVERDFIDFHVVARQLHFRLQLHMVEHGAVEQVFQAGLVVAVQVGKVQHLVGRLAEHIGMALQHDLVLRQGAGLVGAQHVHGAEVLDRVQPFDHHLLFRQFHGALGQGAGDDHRQHFRRQADRHRQREQERFHPVALGPAIDQEHQRRHHQRKADQQPADAVDARFKRGGRALGGRDAGGDRAEIGAVAGGQHQRRGRARNHIGAHEQQVGQVHRILAMAVTASSAIFSTGSDSPVIADWLTNRSLAVSRRQSAGIMSPADSTMMSPCTSCADGQFQLACHRAARWRYCRPSLSGVRRRGSSGLPARSATGSTKSPCCR